MCGRFTSTSTLEQLAEAYDIDEVRAEPMAPRYNVAPTDPVLAVATARPKPPREAAPRMLGVFGWGLVPSWAKDPSIGSRLINARAESVATKPAFRNALTRRRCLIPADAYYEWQLRPGVGTAKKPAKLPWAIRRHDHQPMAFAGLWEVWRDPAQPDGEFLRTCAIVTTGASRPMAVIHDRMPVILEPSAWDIWLDPGIDEVDAISGFLRPAAEDLLEAYPVSTRVNKVSEDGPDLLEPLAEPPANAEVQMFS
ncbi:MAG: SOS response-associated peptidase [Actinomycetota bacterium]|nr:SOS response-associated peptidase [Actinomycetota bacterium]